MRVREREREREREHDPLRAAICCVIWGSSVRVSLDRPLSQPADFACYDEVFFQMASSQSTGALRALAMELRSIRSAPVEGFAIDASENNLFTWTVGIFGPPGTLYQVRRPGGSMFHERNCAGRLLQGVAPLPHQLSVLAAERALPLEGVPSECVRGELRSHDVNMCERGKFIDLPQNGDLCISILHPPIDDPHSGELPCERWNPTQNVR